MTTALHELLRDKQPLLILDNLEHLLRAALARLVARGDSEAAADLGWGLHWFWYVRGYLREGRLWMEQLLADGVALSPRVRARALAVLAMLAFGQADYDSAAAAVEESSRLARAAEDTPVLAFARIVQANALNGLGKDAEALAAAVEGADLYRALENWTGVGLAITVEFQVKAGAGELVRSVTLLDDAERFLRQGGAQSSLAYLLALRAEIAQVAGDYAPTAALCRESIGLSRRLGDAIIILFGLTSLAGALTVEEDSHLAARLFGAVEALQERTGVRVRSAAHRALYDRHVAALRTQLGADAFAIAWAEGRALSLADTTAEALAED